MFGRVHPLAVAISLIFSCAHAEPAVSPATAIALQKQDAGTFYIQGAIEGYGGLDLLLDTGSSFLIITEPILDKLTVSGNARYSHQMSGVMADGTRRAVPVYRLSGIRLGDGCWVDDVEAAVFPGSGRPVLVMNVLIRLTPFTLSAEPPQLALAQCQSQVPKNLAVIPVQPNTSAVR